MARSLIFAQVAVELGKDQRRHDFDQRSGRELARKIMGAGRKWLKPELSNRRIVKFARACKALDHNMPSRHLFAAALLAHYLNEPGARRSVLEEASGKLSFWFCFENITLDCTNADIYNCRFTAFPLGSASRHRLARRHSATQIGAISRVPGWKQSLVAYQEAYSRGAILVHRDPHFAAIPNAKGCQRKGANA